MVCTIVVKDNDTRIAFWQKKNEKHMKLKERPTMGPSKLSPT
jgi:hypothetical protein